MFIKCKNAFILERREISKYIKGYLSPEIQTSSPRCSALLVPVGAHTGGS